jgi:hypothetical protein
LREILWFGAQVAYCDTELYVPIVYFFFSPGEGCSSMLGLYIGHFACLRSRPNEWLKNIQLVLNEFRFLYDFALRRRQLMRSKAPCRLQLAPHLAARGRRRSGRLDIRRTCRLQLAPHPAARAAMGGCNQHSDAGASQRPIFRARHVPRSLRIAIGVPRWLEHLGVVRSPRTPTGTICPLRLPRAISETIGRLP